MSTNDEVLEQLPNDTVRSALLDIIRNNVPSKDYALHMEKGSEKGDNYIGIVHRLSVIYRNDDRSDASEPNKLGIFIKVPPDNKARREMCFARPCFLRESLIYDEYLSLLVEFQQSKGIIPEENGFKEFAKCYKNITKEFEEAVFMEDLSYKGFVMFSRFDSPTADLVKVVIRALGKLHALSFAIKDQWPDKFAKFKELEEIFSDKKEGDPFCGWMNSLNESAYKALAEKGDEKYLKRAKEFFDQKPIFKTMIELVCGANAEPYAVVCHGDCWNNNVLFKFENGKPIDAKLIDWQVARYASPVCDLMYYIFCCTTKSLRDQHYQEILNVYYTELSTFLKRLGSNPEVLFPRSALDDQLRKFGSFGLLMALMVIPTISSKKEDVPDLDDMSAKLKEGDEEFLKEIMEKSSIGCRAKIRDVIVDLIDYGYV